MINVKKYLPMKLSRAITTTAKNITISNGATCKALLFAAPVPKMMEEILMFNKRPLIAFDVVNGYAESKGLITGTVAYGVVIYKDWMKIITVGKYNADMLMSSTKIGKDTICIIHSFTITE